MKQVSTLVRGRLHPIRLSQLGAPTKLVAEWGEEKRRQPQRTIVSSLLQASFDEAVVIYYGVQSKSGENSVD